jgi:hypothetical protein
VQGGRKSAASALLRADQLAGSAVDLVLGVKLIHERVHGFGHRIATAWGVLLQGLDGRTLLVLPRLECRVVGLRRDNALAHAGLIELRLAGIEALQCQLQVAVGLGGMKFEVAELLQNPRMSL